MKMGRMLRASIAAGAVAAVTAACSSSSSTTGPPLPEGGAFSATVTGTVDAQLTGMASSLGTAANPAGWVIEMEADDGASGIVFSEEGMPRPTPGTYPIASALEHGGNAPNSDFTAVIAIGSFTTSFGSTSGTLTITSSSATSVSGEFTFTAEDADDESRTVTVTGTFTSVNQDF